MDPVTPSLQPTVRTDKIDFVVPSRRGLASVQNILEEAAKAPDTWARHSFFIICDTAPQADAITAWMEEQRDVLPLPQVTVLVAEKGTAGNLNALRQQALAAGNNPYVYFQDDDDPLPSGLDRRARIMDNADIVAVYGVTETIDTRNHVVESFPTIVGGAFVADPLEGARWFPTYPHPLAALFKREVFARVPYDDGNLYKICGDGAFLLRLMAASEPVQFLPDVVRRVRHHTDNDSGIMDKKMRLALATDIKTWHPQLKNQSVAAFHKDISNALVAGDITTFKEIDALVEARMEQAQG